MTEVKQGDPYVGNIIVEHEINMDIIH